MTAKILIEKLKSMESNTINYDKLFDDPKEKTTDWIVNDVDAPLGKSKELGKSKVFEAIPKLFNDNLEEPLWYVIKVYPQEKKISSFKYDYDFHSEGELRIILHVIYNDIREIIEKKNTISWMSEKDRKIMTIYRPLVETHFLFYDAEKTLQNIYRASPGLENDELFQQEYPGILRDLQSRANSEIGLSN